MKKLTGNIAFALFLSTLFIYSGQLIAQCTPPMAETCDEAMVLCSLDELNGYACNNPSTIPSPCSPICSQGGIGQNTSWWGFVSQGGVVTIALTIGGCTTTQGLQFGVWGDCICGEEIICKSQPCIPPGSVQVATATLTPCKTYYLWVDGCSGDICDFTLNTSSGGTSPALKPLSFINNDSDRILGPYCEGQCNVCFFIEPQPGGCEPKYVWTLDGNEVGVSDTMIKLDFPVEGDFVICVTAYVGNPKNGSICSQEGPQCATVQVRKPKPNYKLKTVCWEFLKNPKGDTNCIYYPNGMYRCVYTDSNCCKNIDTGNITVLDIPEPADVYYITCDGQPYIDLFGRPHVPCKNQFQINLPKTTDPFKCDSSINLTAVNVEFGPRWRVQCIGGRVEISPNIIIINPCSVGETYEFEYRWYQCNDPNKTTISTDERILVDAVDEKYCLEVNVKVQLETEYAVCSRIFNETFKEGDLAPYAIPIAGDKMTCVNGIGNYWIDTFLSWKVSYFTWTIDGGFIVSNPDSQGVVVKWLLPPGDTGTVCVYYDTDCGKSPETCIKVSFGNESAGKDFKQRGVIAKFNSPSVKSGFWKKVSGPGNALFEKITDPRSRVRVDEYGKYCFEWSVSSPECVSKDTVCIDFYKIKTTDPDSPKRIFDDRNAFLNEEEYFSTEFFTPNLISNSGTSFISMDGEVNKEISYHWFDVYGKSILNGSILVEPRVQRMNFNSPQQEGFYFLVIEINGKPAVRKICVMK